MPRKRDVAKRYEFYLNDEHLVTKRLANDTAAEAHQLKLSREFPNLSVRVVSPDTGLDSVLVYMPAKRRARPEAHTPDSAIMNQAMVDGHKKAITPEELRHA